MLKAKVVFPNRLDKNEYGNKQYDYFTNINNLEEGDLVVVETQYGFSVAKFVTYTDKFKTNAKSHIVQKVDLSKFLLEKERLEKIKDIEAKIKERAEQANKRKFYEQLAQHDDGLKALLDSLDALKND